MNRKTLLCAILLLPFLANVAFSQTYTVNGVLKGKKTKNAVAFAHILQNDTKQGTVSDINGHFSLKTNTPIEFLTIKCLGYKTTTYPIDKKQNNKPITIILEEEAINLSEVVIKPGINPAHRIVQAVIDNRKQNNFQNLNSYKYISHNRGAIEIAFDCPEEEAEIIKKRIKADTTKKEITEIVNYMDSAYLFFTESINEYKYRSPDKVSEVVLASRTSGSKNSVFSLLLTQMQSASFYKNFIYIMSTKFVNPFSKGTFKRYNFELQDTIFDGNDTIFGIKFYPKADSKLNCLSGKAYINTDRYAIQNISASAALNNMPGINTLNVSNDTNSVGVSVSASANKNQSVDSIMSIRIKHSYERDTANRWFPKQYRFEWDWKVFPKDKLVFRFFTQNDIRDVEVNAKIKRREFSDVVLDVDFDATNKDENFWLKYRDTSSVKELNTFTFYDSVIAEIERDTSFDFFNNFSTNRMIEIAKILINGKVPINYINLDLNKLFNYNFYERSRWGLGIETNDKLSRWMSVGGYFGYGFGDKAWKYGGHLNFYFDRYKNYNLGFLYSQDIEPAGSSFKKDYNLVSINYNYNYTMYRYQDVRAAEVFYTMPLFSYTKGKLSFRYSRESYLYDNNNILYPSENPVGTGFSTDFAEASFDIEWRYKQQRIRTPYFEFKVNNSTSFPTLKLSYTRGVSVFNSDKSFNRIMLEYTQYISTLNNNLFTIYASAGHISKNAPYSRLFNVVGTNNFKYYFNNTFLTLAPYSFSSTDYANVSLRYDWNKSLWNTFISKPQLSFQLNSIIGTSHGITTADGINFQAPEKGIAETAICINDLINIGITKIGIGAAYRLSSYNSPSPADNMSVFFNIRIGM